MGRLVESAELAAENLKKNTRVLRPGHKNSLSKLFKAIVGIARLTNKTGQLKGTIPEVIEKAYILEIKHGASKLTLSYQIRLQMYYAVRSGKVLILRTNRPTSAPLRDFMKKWGGKIEPLITK